MPPFPFLSIFKGKGETMKTYFTINNRRYEAKEFDFNLICDLQEMGVNILDMSSIRKNPIPVIRTYVSLCMDADKDVAGEEIQAHIINGGGFEEVLGVITDMMEKSDFFQALNKTTETDTPVEDKKAKKEK